MRKKIQSAKVVIARRQQEVARSTWLVLSASSSPKLQDVQVVEISIVVHMSLRTKRAMGVLPLLAIASKDNDEV